MTGKIPDAVIARLDALEGEVRAIIFNAGSELITELPGSVSFQYRHSAPGDILTVEERAQSVSFITRYEHLPSDYSVQLAERGEKWYIDNLQFLRHALNDFRPIIQNRSDAVFYQRVHKVWYMALVRESPTDGLTIRAHDTTDNDVTPLFAKCVGERNRAITKVLEALEYDYLYNGVLQHSDVAFSKRFLKDYVSGEFNYILWKHVHTLGFIREMLMPYYRLMNVLTFPKLGSL